MDHIDITRSLSEKTPVFPGDPEIKFSADIRDGYRITAIRLSSHSGTHIDAPSHYIAGGMSVDKIPLESLRGDSVVIDLTSVCGRIGKDDIAGRAGNSRIIILKTGFLCEPHTFTSYLPITPGCAEYLAASGITCVVTDAPSIESFDGDGTVHRKLLENEIFIIEMADLSLVKPGEYIFNAMPLKLEGCDGSPVRAVLFIPEGDDCSNESCK